jgi:hypothetical protein
MKQTELEMFASYFHQDFGVLHVSAEEGAQRYLKTLSIDRKAQLSSEAVRFLNQYAGKNHQSKKNAWLKLGAQWWSEEQIIPTLEGITK